MTRQGPERLRALLKVSQLTSVFERVTDLKASVLPTMPDFSFHRPPRPPSGCSNSTAMNRDCLPLYLPQAVQGHVAWQRPTAGAGSEDSFWPMSRSWSSQGSPLPSFHQNGTKEVAKSCGIGQVLFLREPLPNAGGPKRWLVDRYGHEQSHFRRSCSVSGFHTLG